MTRVNGKVQLTSLFEGCVDLLHDLTAACDLLEPSIRDAVNSNLPVDRAGEEDVTSLALVEAIHRFYYGNNYRAFTPMSYQVCHFIRR